MLLKAVYCGSLSTRVVSRRDWRVAIRREGHPVLNYYCFYHHHRHRIIRVAAVLYAGKQLPCNVNEASTTIYTIVIDETKMYKPRRRYRAGWPPKSKKKPVISSGHKHTI